MNQPLTEEHITSWRCPPQIATYMVPYSQWLAQTLHSRKNTYEPFTNVRIPPIEQATAYHYNHDQPHPGWESLTLTPLDRTRDSLTVYTQITSPCTPLFILLGLYSTALHQHEHIPTDAYQFWINEIGYHTTERELPSGRVSCVVLPDAPERA